MQSECNPSAATSASGQRTGFKAETFVTEFGKACNAAEHAVAVVPCDRVTGKPLVPLDQASTDIAQIKRWFLEEFRGAVAHSVTFQARQPFWRYPDFDSEAYFTGKRLKAEAKSDDDAAKTYTKKEKAADSDAPRDTQRQATNISATPFVLRDDTTKTPRRAWLYGEHLVRQFGACTIGLGGVGKSSLEIVEALALVTQRPLLGIPVYEQCRVWYWNGEDPMDELERRFNAACIHYGLKPEDIAGQLFVNSGRDCDIIVATQTRHGVIIAEPVVEALLKTIRDNRIDVVIIDPFVSSHRVVENDNSAIEAVAKTWVKIADEANIAIDLSHHSRKTGGAEVTVEDGRGAVALINACRTVRALNAMTPEEAKQCDLDYRRGEFFRVDDGKTNMALPAAKAGWYRMASVDLHNGPLGPTFPGGDQVGVATAWNRPNPMAGITDMDFERVALVIKSGSWRKNEQANAWVGYAVAQGIPRLSVAKDRAKIKALIKHWLAQGKLVEVSRIDPERRDAHPCIEVAEPD